MNADIDRAYVGLPGTGKTTTLLDVLREELESGTDPDRIAASTFRKSMAQEFEQRAAGVLDDGLPEDHWFGTTHSLCYRLLGYEDVLTAQDKAEFCQNLGVECAASQSLADKADLTSSNGGSDVGDLAFQARSWCLNTNHDPGEDYKKSPLSVNDRTEVQYSSTSFKEFNEAYEAFKDEKGLIDFDDMLLIVRDQGLVPDADVLIEDEFQDKSPLQVDIFEQWSGEIDRTYVAGDPYQAIYGFAGTRPQYMEEATELASESSVLDTSYRFGSELWQFATRILERADYDVPEIEPVGSSSVKRMDYSTYRTLVDKHAEEECLHLFRCNYMADNAADVLKRTGVPFSSPTGVRWTDRLVDLYNGISKLAKTAKAVEQNRQFGGLRAQYDLKHIHANEALEVAKAMRATEQQGTKKGNVNRLEEVADPDEDLTRADINLFDVFSIGSVADKVRNDANPVASSAFTQSGFGSSSARDRLESAYQQLGGETIDSINHRLLTMHGAKGAEADNVFLFNGVSRRIHSDNKPFPFRSPDEARVFFVGATRAKKNLYIVEHPQEPTFDLPR